MQNWASSPIKLASHTLFVLSVAWGQSEFIESFDPEKSLPESDLIILKNADIFYRELTPESAELLAQLSFISESDVRELLDIENRVDSLKITSPFLQKLIQSIWADQKASPVSGMITQRMNRTEDIQYRWAFDKKFDNYQLGVLGERDAGELSAVDYSAFYLKSRWRQIDFILGNYQFLTGHGLVSWRSMPLKSDFGASNSVMRVGKGIQPYRSGHESWALRGIALRKEFEFGLLFTGFSSRKLDGTIKGNSVSISHSGLHQSESQLEKKNNLSEIIFLNQYTHPIRHGNLSIVLGLGEWEQNASRLSNQILSFVGQFQKEFISVSGESSVNTFGNSAYIFSSKMKWDSFQYGLSTRWIEPNYFGLRDNVFRNWNSLELGEAGILHEIRFKLKPAFITVYSDQFKRLKSAIGHFTQTGSETGLKVDTKLTPTHQITFQTKWQENTSHSYDYTISDYNPTSSIRTKIHLKWHRSKRNTVQCQLQQRNHPIHQIKSYGLQFRNQLRQDRWKLNQFWMSTIIQDDQWLYFWDLTLPGEMRSKVFTNSGHFMGCSISYDASQLSEIHFRISSHWPQLDFEVVPIVRSAIQINLFI